MEIVRKAQFKRDFKRALKQGKDLKKLKRVIDLLQKGSLTDPKYLDHSLRGIYSKSRECHLEPDFLLVYTKIQDKDKNENLLVLERLGSHSELFG